jgi:hypothetical protein
VSQPAATPPRKTSSSIMTITTLLGIALILVLVVVGAMMLLRIGQQTQQMDDFTQQQQQQQQEFAGQQQDTAIEIVMFQTTTAFQQFARRLQLPPLERKLGANCDQVTREMTAIDLSDCPKDFQEKYAAVIKTWGDVSVAVKKGRGEMVVSGRAIFEGMRLDFQSPFEDVRTANEAVKRFQDACEDLARCARENGAG